MRAVVDRFLVVLIVCRLMLGNPKLVQGIENAILRFIPLLRREIVPQQAGIARALPSRTD